jgi:hypothetical protein
MRYSRAGLFEAPFVPQDKQGKQAQPVRIGAWVFGQRGSWVGQAEKT